MSKTNIIWAAKYDYSKNWGIKEHTHDFYQVYYIVSGTGTFAVGDQVINAKPDDFILVTPLVKHSLLKMIAGNMRIFDVKFTVTDDELAHKLLRFDVPFRNTNKDVPILFDKLRNEWKSNLIHNRDLSHLLLTQILYYMLRKNLTPSNNQCSDEMQAFSAQYHGLSGDIERYILSNYNSDISLDILAENLKYNKNYICKRFKADTGSSIKEFVNYVRIRRALELVGKTDKTFTQISDEVGFKNVHHFSRVFKKVTNCTPQMVKNQQKGNLYSDIIEHGRFIYRYYCDN